MRVDTLGADSKVLFLKTNSSSGNRKNVFPEGNTVLLIGKLTANNVKSVTDNNFADNLVLFHMKENTNPNYSQPALKNLCCTDDAMLSHKSNHERTLVTMQNNNVESLPSIYFTRPTCGNTYTTKAPKRCGISMTNGTKTVNISY